MMDGNRQNIAKGDVRFGVWIMLCSTVFYLCIRPSDVLNLSTCCTWKTASSILTCRKNQHRWTKSNIWKELSEWLGVLLIAQNRNRVRFTFWFRWLGLVTWNTKLYNVDANMSEVIQERLCENWQRTDFCGLLATRYVALPCYVPGGPPDACSVCSCNCQVYVTVPVPRRPVEDEPAASSRLSPGEMTTR